MSRVINGLLCSSVAAAATATKDVVAIWCAKCARQRKIHSSHY